MLKLRIQTNQLFINFRVHASSLWNWNVGKYVQRQKKLRIYAPAIIARAMEFICKFRFLKFYKIRRIVAIIFFTRPSIEISSKTHLLEFPTVTHVVKKQLKCILLNERPCDISLVPIRARTNQRLKIAGLRPISCVSEDSVPALGRDRVINSLNMTGVCLPQPISIRKAQSLKRSPRSLPFCLANH